MTSLLSRWRWKKRTDGIQLGTRRADDMHPTSRAATAAPGRTLWTPRASTSGASHCCLRTRERVPGAGRRHERKERSECPTFFASPQPGSPIDLHLDAIRPDLSRLGERQLQSTDPVGEETLTAPKQRRE